MTKVYLVQTVNDYYAVETHGVFADYESANTIAKGISLDDEENDFITISISVLDLSLDTTH